MSDLEVSLAGALARLATLHPRRIDLSLDRIRALLDRLGRPQDRLPPVIHVAGTNGKGSTVAFLRACLEADGRTVHTYTSPHLVRFNERIRLAAPGGGRLVDDAALLAALAEAERINAGEPITFFEITTAAALSLFAERPADVCLLEVGLGGALDTTNVVERPLAAVITPVSHDHADFLGEAIEGIAEAKAGILKRGCPGVIGPQGPAALATIRREAERVRAPLFVHGEDYTAFAERGRLVYQDEDGLLDLPLPYLPGAHQVDNAGLAVAGLRRAGLALPTSAIEAGIAGARWPARMQRLREGPLVDAAPRGSDIWLDGGHNPAAGEALAAALGALEERDARPLVLICGMLTTKDPAGFLRPFAGLARRVMTVPVPDSEASFAPAALAEIAMGVDVPARAYPDIRAALAELSDASGEPPRIAICGSLYLAGAVLRENGPLPD